VKVSELKRDVTCAIFTYSYVNIIYQSILDATKEVFPPSCFADKQNIIR